MAFLRKTEAQVAFDKVWLQRNRLYREAVALRNTAAPNAAALAGIVNTLADFKAEWATASQMAGIADVAEAETAQTAATLVADYNAVAAAGDAVGMWIVNNIENASQQLPGFVRVGTRYNLLTLSTGLAPLHTLLDTLITALEG